MVLATNEAYILWRKEMTNGNDKGICSSLLVRRPWKRGKSAKGTGPIKWE